MNRLCQANFLPRVTCCDFASNPNIGVARVVGAESCTVCLTASGVAAGAITTSRNSLDGGSAGADCPARSGSG